VVPLLKDANAVLMGLMQGMQLRSTGQMDHKTAGSILYALQTASSNQRLTLFEPRKATDVVIDRGTVHATYRGGPQWVAEDFDDEVESEDEDAIGEEVPVAAQGTLKKVAGKAVAHISISEARTRVKQKGRFSATLETSLELRSITEWTRFRSPRLPEEARGCIWSSCCGGPTRANGWSADIGPE
jgi:hypothetical protein